MPEETTVEDLQLEIDRLNAKIVELESQVGVVPLATSKRIEQTITRLVEETFPQGNSQVPYILQELRREMGW